MIESMVISLLFPCFMRCLSLFGGFLSQPVKRQKERRKMVSHPLSDQLMVGMLCCMVSCPCSIPSNHITSTSHLNDVCERCSCKRYHDRGSSSHSEKALL